MLYAEQNNILIWLWTTTCMFLAILAKGKPWICSQFCSHTLLKKFRSAPKKEHLLLKIIYWMAWGLSKLTANFHFWVKYSLNVDHILLMSLKGIVHFEINFWYVLAYLKGIQDVGVFVSTVWLKNVKIENTVETKTPTSWMPLR